MKVSRLLVVASLSLSGCSYLAFLKPPSVPRERGDTETIRGAATGVTARRTAIDPSQDWATYNGTFEGTRSSPLAGIDQSNVGRLKPLCAFPLGEQANLQSGIVEVGGVMFVTTAVNTYAIDAATCALVWKHTYEYKPKPPFDPNMVNRGIGYLDMPGGPRVFRGANDGRVYALDARTGEEMWNVAAGDPERGETFPAAPIAWHGLVYIGNAGGDNFGVTGRMMAFDAQDGGRVWSVALAPENGEASTSWPRATETVPKGGAASWTSYALDTTTATVYVPTGNSAPDFLQEV
ncbi:MAG: PQQ-binding-like beta-propeller repeat protein, partial [Gemmatimonadota bacterium]|nr:PQQ-binding-like beta-propeller repeat protein [Gemmatimonadota bacterium]